MEALDREWAEAVGGGTTLDSFLAALARDGALARNGSVTGRMGEVFN